ncbi:hypothetical protein DRJ17_05500, partial [Candidatus Woesearchaeota archaeon]
MVNWREKIWVKIIALTIVGVFTFSEVTWAARADYTYSLPDEGNTYQQQASSGPGQFLWQIYQAISSFLLPSAHAETNLILDEKSRNLPQYREPFRSIKDTISIEPVENNEYSEVIDTVCDTDIMVQTAQNIDNQANTNISIIEIFQETLQDIKTALLNKLNNIALRRSENTGANSIGSEQAQEGQDEAEPTSENKIKASAFGLEVIIPPLKHIFRHIIRFGVINSENSQNQENNPGIGNFVLQTIKGWLENSRLLSFIKTFIGKSKIDWEQPPSQGPPQGVPYDDHAALPTDSPSQDTGESGLILANPEQNSSINQAQTGRVSTDDSAVPQAIDSITLHNNDPPTLDYNCAVLALSEILNISPDILAQDLAIYTQNGETSLYGIQQVAAEYGLDLSAVELTYQELASIEGPVIVHLNLENGAGHYVVVTQATAEEVTYIDNGVTKTASKEEFEALWSGYALTIQSGIGIGVSEAKAQAVTGSWGWSNICSFVDGVVDAAVDLVDTAVDTAVNVVETAATAVVDSVAEAITGGSAETQTYNSASGNVFDAVSTATTAVVDTVTQAATTANVDISIDNFSLKIDLDLGALDINTSVGLTNGTNVEWNDNVVLGAELSFEGGNINPELQVGPVDLEFSLGKDGYEARIDYNDNPLFYTAADIKNGDFVGNFEIGSSGWEFRWNDWTSMGFTSYTADCPVNAVDTMFDETGGRDVSRADIANFLDVVDSALGLDLEEGNSLAAVALALEQGTGLEYNGYLVSIEDIARLDQPVIAYTEPNAGEGHYVVIKEVTEHNVVIETNGNEVNLTRDEFAQQFALIDGKGFILCAGQPEGITPLTASQLEQIQGEVLPIIIALVVIGIALAGYSGYSLWDAHHKNELLHGKLDADSLEELVTYIQQNKDELFAAPQGEPLSEEEQILVNEWINENLSEEVIGQVEEFVGNELNEHNQGAINKIDVAFNEAENNLTPQAREWLANYDNWVNAQSELVRLAGVYSEGNGWSGGEYSEELNNYEVLYNQALDKARQGVEGYEYNEETEVLTMPEDVYNQLSAAMEVASPALEAVAGYQEASAKLTWDENNSIIVPEDAVAYFNLLNLSNIVHGKVEITGLGRTFDSHKDTIILTDKSSESTLEGESEGDSALIIVNLNTATYGIELEYFDPYISIQRLEVKESEVPDYVKNYIRSRQGIAEVRHVEGSLDKYGDPKEQGGPLGWLNAGVWETDYKPYELVNVLLVNESGEMKVVQEVRELEFSAAEEHIRQTWGLTGWGTFVREIYPENSEGFVNGRARIYLSENYTRLDLICDAVGIVGGLSMVGSGISLLVSTAAKAGTVAVSFGLRGLGQAVKAGVRPAIRAVAKGVLRPVIIETQGIKSPALRALIGMAEIGMYWGGVYAVSDNAYSLISGDGFLSPAESMESFTKGFSLGFLFSAGAQGTGRLLGWLGTSAPGISNAAKWVGSFGENHKILRIGLRQASKVAVGFKTYAARPEYLAGDCLLSASHFVYIGPLFAIGKALWDSAWAGELEGIIGPKGETDLPWYQALALHSAESPKFGLWFGPVIRVFQFKGETFKGVPVIGDAVEAVSANLGLVGIPRTLARGILNTITKEKLGTAFAEITQQSIRRSGTAALLAQLDSVGFFVAFTSGVDSLLMETAGLDPQTAQLLGYLAFMLVPAYGGGMRSLKQEIALRDYQRLIELGYKNEDILNSNEGDSLAGIPVGRELVEVSSQQYMLANPDKIFDAINKQEAERIGNEIIDLAKQVEIKGTDAIASSDSPYRDFVEKVVLPLKADMQAAGKEWEWDAFQIGGGWEMLRAYEASMRGEAVRLIISDNAGKGKTSMALPVARYICERYPEARIVFGTSEAGKIEELRNAEGLKGFERISISIDKGQTELSALTEPIKGISIVDNTTLMGLASEGKLNRSFVFADEPQAGLAGPQLVFGSTRGIWEALDIQATQGNPVARWSARRQILSIERSRASDQALWDCALAEIGGRDLDTVIVNRASQTDSGVKNGIRLSFEFVSSARNEIISRYRNALKSEEGKQNRLINYSDRDLQLLLDAVADLMKYGPGDAYSLVYENGELTGYCTRDLLRTGESLPNTFFGDDGSGLNARGRFLAIKHNASNSLYADTLRSQTRDAISYAEALNQAAGFIGLTATAKDYTDSFRGVLGVQQGNILELRREPDGIISKVAIKLSMEDMPRNNVSAVIDFLKSPKGEKTDLILLSCADRDAILKTEAQLLAEKAEGRLNNRDIEIISVVRDGVFDFANKVSRVTAEIEKDPARARIVLVQGLIDAWNIAKVSPKAKARAAIILTSLLSKVDLAQGAQRVGLTEELARRRMEGDAYYTISIKDIRLTSSERALLEKSENVQAQEALLLKIAERMVVEANTQNLLRAQRVVNTPNSRRPLNRNQLRNTRGSNTAGLSSTGVNTMYVPYTAGQILEEQEELVIDADSAGLLIRGPPTEAIKYNCAVSVVEQILPSIPTEVISERLPIDENGETSMYDILLIANELAQEYGLELNLEGYQISFEDAAELNNIEVVHVIDKNSGNGHYIANFKIDLQAHTVIYNDNGQVVTETIDEFMAKYDWTGYILASESVYATATDFDVPQAPVIKGSWTQGATAVSVKIGSQTEWVEVDSTGKMINASSGLEIKSTYIPYYGTIQILKTSTPIDLGNGFTLAGGTVVRLTRNSKGTFTAAVTNGVLINNSNYTLADGSVVDAGSYFYFNKTSFGDKIFFCKGEYTRADGARIIRGMAGGIIKIGDSGYVNGIIEYVEGLPQVNYRYNFTVDNSGNITIKTAKWFDTREWNPTLGWFGDHDITDSTILNAFKQRTVNGASSFSLSSLTYFIPWQQIAEFNAILQDLLPSLNSDSNSQSDANSVSTAADNLKNSLDINNLLVFINDFYNKYANFKSSWGIWFDDSADPETWRSSVLEEQAAIIAEYNTWIEEFNNGSFAEFSAILEDLGLG